VADRRLRPDRQPEDIAGEDTVRSLGLRALAVWFALMAAETLHGILRTLFLEPLVGGFRARQIGVATGAGIILLLAWLLTPWLDARGKGELLGVGVAWLVLTLGFEILLGRVVFGYGWDRVLADYDLRRGGLLGLGMVVLVLAPWIGACLRGGVA
jgi:hypothetical protein